MCVTDLCIANDQKFTYRMTCYCPVKFSHTNNYSIRIYIYKYSVNACCITVRVQGKFRKLSLNIVASCKNNWLLRCSRSRRVHINQDWTNNQIRCLLFCIYAHTFGCASFFCFRFMIFPEKRFFFQCKNVGGTSSALKDGTNCDLKNDDSEAFVVLCNPYLDLKSENNHFTNSESPRSHSAAPPPPLHFPATCSARETAL